MTRARSLPRLTRRGALGLGAGLAAGALLAGCGEDSPKRAARPQGTPEGTNRVRYGDDHGLQFADLRLPRASSLATVVLLHGGYWLPQYGLELMDPLAERFTELGYATWNVEYRRTGEGGGVPATLADVAAAVDRLAGQGLPAGLTDKVVVVGHSAGGHLAAWAASRTAATPGGVARVPVKGAISLSGVLDLTMAATDPRSQEPVTAFVGGTPTEVPGAYAIADPARLVPPACPVWAVHAEDDQVVPPEQSSSYTARARAAGGRVESVTVPGDHYTIIDPASDAFPVISKLVAGAVA